ncbi:hypothetical protein CD798_03225 [Bacillaceae bacterium SAOS 7]|nr:hypothetical protein CD798_03225 [Bacillaceae bacterium SAOS 7]
MIFASSAAVYGEPCYLPIDEAHPKQSLSYYALSKTTAEEYIQLFSKQFGLNYSILRFSNVYGPGQNVDGEAGVISIFIDQLLKDMTPTIYGGKQTRDFVYVKDVVSALVKTAQIDSNGIFNISSNTEITIKEVLEALMKNIPTNAPPQYAAPKVGDILKSRLNNKKAMNALQWKPLHSLSEGLTHTVKSYKNKPSAD